MGRRAHRRLPAQQLTAPGSKDLGENELWALLLSWLPFVILIGVWLILTRVMSRRTNSSMELMRESIELQKQSNACLEEIKAELKRR
jgi:ATP-dependent Zn protease